MCAYTLKFLFFFFSPLRLTGWVLLKLFNSFFWNIQIHKGQLEMVKAATEARSSVICHSIFPCLWSDVRVLLYGNVLLCAVCIPTRWKIPPERWATVAFGEGRGGAGKGAARCRIPSVSYLATTLKSGRIIPIYK